MSDLASPLLVVQIDEAQAYVCFCGLMARLQGNFSTDGRAMSIQFQHLAHLLQVHDMAFYDYLDSVNAKNLFFCYRWMLLQLKREFPFDDALYMFEVCGLCMLWLVYIVPYVHCCLCTLWLLYIVACVCYGLSTLWLVYVVACVHCGLCMLWLVYIVACVCYGLCTL